MSYAKLIKKLSIILIILGNYSLCAYTLKEVRNLKDYTPKAKINIKQNKSKETVKEAKEQTQNQTKKIEIKKNYLGTLNIPKINLKRYLYPIDSYQNNVNKNVEILKQSNMPDITNGNLILAAHNGNTSLGHFKNINQLEKNDIIEINYNNVNYIYEVDSTYEVLKTGKVSIKRDKNQNTITLITCKGIDKQLVVIGYLRNT